jgi:outer membrane immunogenic protein
MNRILLTSVAAVALLAAGAVNSADAADIARKAPPYVAPPPPPPVFSWTGCFVGAHWGWGWGRKTVDESEIFTDVTDGDDSFSRSASGKMETSGGIFGGQVGCDYQFGWGKGKDVGGPGLNWVIGIQFDAAGTDINDEMTDPFARAFEHDQFAAAEFGRIGVKEDWLGSLTGRLGITGFGGWSHTLWYVRGGVAWTHDRWDLHGTNEFFNDFPVFSPLKENRTGWTVGVGWEWAFLPNWSAFVEWNHYDFGTKTLLRQSVTFTEKETLAVTETFTDDLALSTKQTLETVKIGVNYRFNFGKAPVVARY